MNEQTDHSIIPTPAPQLADMSDWVTGVIDTLPDALQALEELRVQGFSSEQVMLLDGSAGVRALEAQQHSNESVMDFLRKLTGGSHDAGHIADDYVAEGEQGHINLWVQALAPERVTLARTILQAHGGHTIRSNGPWTTEQIG